MTISNKLYEAVGENDLNGLKVLLETPDQKEDYGKLLSIAVTHNFSEIATLLLEHNADPNHITSQKSEETPLFSAVRSLSRSLITRLLEHKADINKQNNEGKTVLYYRVNVADEASVKLLLENKADPNIQDNQGNIPIFYARNTAIFTLLLDYNSDIDLQNKAGDSIWSVLEDPTLSNYNSHLSKALQEYQNNQLTNTKITVPEFSGDSYGNPSADIVSD